MKFVCGWTRIRGKESECDEKKRMSESEKNNGYDAQYEIYKFEDCCIIYIQICK